MFYSTALRIFTFDFILIFFNIPKTFTILKIINYKLRNMKGLRVINCRDKL